MTLLKIKLVDKTKPMILLQSWIRQTSISLDQVKLFLGLLKEKDDNDG